MLAFWLCAFLGGAGRLVSMVVAGVPSAPLLGFTVIEVVGAPLVLSWHAQVTRTLGVD